MLELLLTILPLCSHLMLTEGLASNVQLIVNVPLSNELLIETGGTSKNGQILNIIRNTYIVH